MAKQAEINIRVQLDDKQVPEKIFWQASDADFEGEKAAESFNLAVWDADAKTSLTIDLWTKELTVQDMNMFFYQKLVKMAETYGRSTPFKETAELIASFADQFAQKVEDESQKMS